MISGYKKTPIFLLFAIILALVYNISEIAYLLFGSIIILIFFKKYLNVLLIFLFISIHFLSSSFFIINESYDDKTGTVAKAGSGRIYLEKKFDIEQGDILRGKFYQIEDNASVFFKPRFKAEGDVRVAKVPLISKLLKYRSAHSDYLFYASGGRVSVAQALIFGDKRFIPDTVRDEYTVSGLAHLLAMSGMHVGIIVAIFLTALFFLPFKFRLLFALIGVICLTILGAFSITVVRAAIFSAVWMITYILDIRIERKQFLLLIAGVFLIISPSSVTDISFLLSFGAVFGIIYLVGSGVGKIKAGFLIGIAATLITAPLSLYVFSTTNHLSILSTIIMSPVMYLHILFAIISIALPNIAIAPLIWIESISNSLLHIIYDYTYFGFILKSIPLWVLIVTLVFTICAMLSRYKWIATLSLLIIFYPSPKPPDMIFPNLWGSNKGFISFIDNRSEIFYQGSPAGFKYAFLPIAAKYGVKEFDYGNIRIFSGKNNYIRVKNNGLLFTDVCLNAKLNECKVIYHTKSNSIKKNDIDGNTLHIIYKSKFKDDSIIEISKRGMIEIDEGVIRYINEDISE